LFGAPYDAFRVPEEAMPAFSLPGAQREDLPLGSPFQVFFFQFVLDAMWRHARESPALECAGLLLGHPFVKPGELAPEGEPISFLIVAASLPYHTPERSRGHVRITAESLSQADREARREHSGLRPVGWYHTHPGHGIFLSGHDSVITHSIFNAAWQIAVVLDPVQNLPLGLFRGADEERLPGYRVLRELPVELALMQQYNQAMVMLESRQLKRSLSHFERLDRHFREVQADLPFWYDKPTYRDVDQWIQRLQANLTSDPPAVAGHSAGAPVSEASPEGQSPDHPHPVQAFGTSPSQFPEGGEPAARAASPPSRPVGDRVTDRVFDLFGSIVSVPGKVVDAFRRPEPSTPTTRKENDP
jgi:proteasome lid subunit RPN8/RPN11